MTRTSLIFALLLSSVGMNANAQEQFPQMKMRMAHFLPATFAEADVDQWFADEVKRRSGGNIEIEVFWSGSLGGPQELLSLLSSGAIELAGFPHSYYVNELPLHAAATLPRVYVDAETAYEANMKLLNSPPLRAEQEKNGIAMLVNHASNPYRLACNKAVNTIGDLAGLRVRSVGVYYPVLFNEIGMTPVNLPATEVYEGLDRGTLNCALLSYDMMISSKIYEVAKNVSDINLGALGTWQVWANQSALQDMPESVRNLLVEVGEEATKRDLAAVQAKNDSATGTLSGLGTELAQFADKEKLAGAAPDTIALWVENMTKLGLEGDLGDVIEIVGQAKSRFKD